jgi:hypothetical protein
VTTGKPNIPPNNSVPRCPETVQLVPPVVEKVAVLKYGNAIPWDRPGPDAMNRLALSRWRHGLKPYWDRQVSDQRLCILRVTEPEPTSSMSCSEHRLLA